MFDAAVLKGKADDMPVDPGLGRYARNLSFIPVMIALVCVFQAVFESDPEVVSVLKQGFVIFLVTALFIGGVLPRIITEVAKRRRAALIEHCERHHAVCGYASGAEMLAALDRDAKVQQKDWNHE